MAKFRYKRGDRPLDGYTIEHGLGVGGFGEVYFAISDAGREVALKSLQNYEEIELRGIRHCMNLKSPHLVSVFDVKYNDAEEPFVIMEYVQGPSLRQLLDASPEGIGATKAAFFLREMAKGLTYLHEAGVVHRDLKPHNVFYEDGYVKIGDYSLCKMISTSHRTGHTMTVGTVHYMAPEISQGRYDASVDVYALGVMLFEMLTGLPPFQGDSLGEVLMKHMTAEPDLSKVEEPYRSVIAKALAKNPEDRFATSADMVEAVFGTEHVQNSVVEFNPQELTLVANMATKRAFATPSGRRDPGSDRPGGASWGKDWKPDNAGSNPEPPNAGKDTDVPIPPETVLFEKKPRKFVSKEETPKDRVEKDAIPLLGRLAMALFAVPLLGHVVYLSSPNWPETDAGVAAGAMIAVGLTAALIARWTIGKLPFRNGLVPRIAIGGAVGVVALITGPHIPLLLSICLPFFAFDWFSRTSRNRPHRIDAWLLIFTVLLAFAAAKHLSNRHPLADFPILAPVVAFGIGFCLQLISPFNGFKSEKRHSKTSPQGAAQAEAPVARITPANFVNDEPVVAAVAPPSPPAAAKSSERHPDLQPSVSNGHRTLGLILFSLSAIIAMFAMQPTFAPNSYSPNYSKQMAGFAMFGFVLVLPAFGLMLKSNAWSGGAFGRLIGACMVMAWLHISCASHDFDTPMAMMLPAAVMLLAWPNKTKKIATR